jgi:hypothetical protein
MKLKFLSAAVLALGLAGASQAATIGLEARNLKLGNEIASSSQMLISDTAPTDLGFAIFPGFFQAFDNGSDPALELNTGDGISFNLSVTPGFAVSTDDTAREGNRQLDLFFGTDYFARLLLADGDSLDNILTGATFGDAELTVWEVEVVPLPAGLPLLLTGMGGIYWLRRRQARA